MAGNACATPRPRENQVFHELSTRPSHSKATFRSESKFDAKVSVRFECTTKNWKFSISRRMWPTMKHFRGRCSVTFTEPIVMSFGGKLTLNLISSLPWETPERVWRISEKNRCFRFSGCKQGQLPIFPLKFLRCRERSDHGTRVILSRSSIL